MAQEEVAAAAEVVEVVVCAAAEVVVCAAANVAAVAKRMLVYNIVCWIRGERRKTTSTGIAKL